MVYEWITPGTLYPGYVITRVRFPFEVGGDAPGPSLITRNTWWAVFYIEKPSPSFTTFISITDQPVSKGRDVSGPGLCSLVDDILRDLDFEPTPYMIDLFIERFINLRLLVSRSFTIPKDAILDYFADLP